MPSISCRSIETCDSRQKIKFHVVRKGTYLYELLFCVKKLGFAKKLFLYAAHLKHNLYGCSMWYSTNYPQNADNC